MSFVCDTCKTEKQGDNPGDWHTGTVNGRDFFHYCSFRCLEVASVSRPALRPLSLEERQTFKR